MPGRTRLLVYVGSTGVAALAAVAFAARGVDVIPALVAVAAVCLSEFAATSFRDDATVSLSSVVILVAVIVGGTPLAVIAAMGVIPAILVQASDMRLTRVAFNWGQYTLSAGAAGLVHATLAGRLGGGFPDWESLLAIGLGAAAFSLVNHGLVTGVISLSSTDGFWPTFRTVGYPLLLQVPYVGIAVLAAVVLQRASMWALALMAVPVVIARYGLLAFQRLDESYDRLVRSFVKAIEIKDLYTRGHSERVAELAVYVAEELGVGYEERRLTRYAALLHDVGKIGVPLCIINKPGPLDDAEFEAIKKHPLIGAEILHDIDFLTPAIDIVRYHHERLDGRGYPFGMSAAELSDIVRIVTVADAFDAMTSTRSYRRALSVEDAVAELRRCAGQQFDPRMVEALAAVAERIAWTPTVEFASEAELHGHDIPVVGTFQERARLSVEVRSLGT